MIHRSTERSSSFRIDFNCVYLLCIYISPCSHCNNTFDIAALVSLGTVSVSARNITQRNFMRHFIVAGPVLYDHLYRTVLYIHGSDQILLPLLAKLSMSTMLYAGYSNGSTAGTQQRRVSPNLDQIISAEERNKTN